MSLFPVGPYSLASLVPPRLRDFDTLKMLFKDGNVFVVLVALAPLDSRLDHRIKRNVGNLLDLLSYSPLLRSSNLRREKKTLPNYVAHAVNP